MALYTGKPFKELIDRCAIFEVFKKGPDWNTGTTKHPSTTYSVTVAFHLSAVAPLFHEPKLILEIMIRKPRPSTRSFPQILHP